VAGELDPKRLQARLDKVRESRRGQVVRVIDAAVESGVKPAKLPKAPQPDDFRAVLTRLASDENFRTEATANPQLLLDNFKLDVQQLQALRQVAAMSGADLSSVNLIRAEAIARGRVPGGEAATDVDVSCCSCCCCCCGETAVAPV
jgi:hypothetical protein